MRGPVDELAVSQGCYFDEECGQVVVDFIERFCVQSKGRWGGVALSLLEWQKDYIMRLFGWRRADGRRRFTKSYLEIAKKNGKSTLISALVLYFLIADGENAPEIFINASDREQASIIYTEAERMVRRSTELSKRIHPVPSRKRLICDANDGVIVANSADADNKDGANASHILFDELHRQRDRQLWDVFEYAGESREQPLRIAITTAGEDETGVWYEQREYSEQVNDGRIPDSSHLGVVYRALPEDDIDSPETWRKANPSLGFTIDEADFAAKLSEAKEVPIKLANFLRLRLNLVTAERAVYIELPRWDACAAPVTPALRRKHKACWSGGDLSSTTDITSVLTIFGDKEDGFDVIGRHYLPEESINESSQRDKQPYRLWAEAGFLTLTPGSVIDYEFCREDVGRIAEEYDLRLMLLDPYNATQFVLNLQADGIPCDFIRQGYISISAPTKELRRLVISRKIRHGGDPILRWMIGNCVVEQDALGNHRLTKKRSRGRIDGIAALINAVAAATAAADDGGSVYDTRGVIAI